MRLKNRRICFHRSPIAGMTINSINPHPEEARSAVSKDVPLALVCLPFLRDRPSAFLRMRPKTGKVSTSGVGLTQDMNGTGDENPCERCEETGPFSHQTTHPNTYPAIIEPETASAR